MIKENKIDIKYGSLFPWQFQLIAALIFVVGLSLIVEKTLIAVLLMLFGAFILSSYEGTEIDKGAKTYREYQAFFLVKFGVTMKYSAIEKIFVTASKKKQKVYTAHTNHSSTFENVEFNGFLKFNDSTKIPLLRKRKKIDLIHRLEGISKFLDVPLEDNTRINS